MSNFKAGTAVECLFGNLRESAVGVMAETGHSAAAREGFTADRCDVHGDAYFFQAFATTECFCADGCQIVIVENGQCGQTAAVAKSHVANDLHTLEIKTGYA